MSFSDCEGSVLKSALNLNLLFSTRPRTRTPQSSRSGYQLFGRLSEEGLCGGVAGLHSHKIQRLRLRIRGFGATRVIGKVKYVGGLNSFVMCVSSRSTARDG